MGYLELSTAEYWRNLGIGIYHLPRSGYFDLAVVKTTIEFRSPALVDEIVEARVRVSRIGNSSMDMQMELHRPEPETLLTTIEAVYVPDTTQPPEPLAAYRTIFGRSSTTSSRPAKF